MLFSGRSVRGGFFIVVCWQRIIPLVFFENVCGFMVGEKYEAGWIAREGAKLVAAGGPAGVLKFSVLIAGSYGPGNYHSPGPTYSPRYLWMWPNARISVMGDQQAPMVLGQARRDNIQANADPWSAEQQDKSRAPIPPQYE